MGDMADWQIDQFFMEDDGPRPCRDCEGTGLVYYGDRREFCPTCDGEGYE